VASFRPKTLVALSYHLKALARNPERIGPQREGSAAQSIFRRSLNVIDHKNFYRSVLGNQPEAQLLL
jgi:hypothetical protein